jgi:transposase InsO family protein
MECALGPDISGEMIRDMMVHCVERRFDMLRAPHQVQSLSDHGSIFVARRTIEIALALNLAPYFTPVESPENNGMAEAFVKTFKRDYVRVSPSPNAAGRAHSHRQLDGGLQHRAPHSRFGYRSSFPTVACPG